MSDPSLSVSRRSFVRLGAAFAAGSVASAIPLHPAHGQNDQLTTILSDAAELAFIETAIISHNGAILAERGYRGHSVTAPTNIKSASKTIISALIGIAIDRDVLEGVRQRVAPILRSDIPAGADPRIEDITIGHLLSMQAGLRPTSGPQYGRWIASPNWVRSALDQPFDDDPGGRMLYSTGSTHLLSAILTIVTGRPTLDLARDWLGAIEDFSIDGWERDPQGIYLGGNEMAMSPRSLLAFGETYRNGGVATNGTRIVSQDWIDQSWQAQTTSRYTNDGYGYGWFLGTMADEEVCYAWGYGGQMLYIVPRLELTIVMTSDDTPRPTTITDRDALHVLSTKIIEAVQQQS